MQGARETEKGPAAGHAPSHRSRFLALVEPDGIEPTTSTMPL